MQVRTNSTAQPPPFRPLLSFLFRAESNLHYKHQIFRRPLSQSTIESNFFCRIHHRVLESNILCQVEYFVPQALEGDSHRLNSCLLSESPSPSHAIAATSTWDAPSVNFA
jgi:hypothetical protein